jgi:hypothetical protein
MRGWAKRPRSPTPCPDNESRPKGWAFPNRLIRAQGPGPSPPLQLEADSDAGPDRTGAPRPAQGRRWGHLAGPACRANLHTVTRHGAGRDGGEAVSHNARRLPQRTLACVSECAAGICSYQLPAMTEMCEVWRRLRSWAGSGQVDHCCGSAWPRLGRPCFPAAAARGTRWRIARASGLANGGLRLRQRCRRGVGADGPAAV